MNNLQTQNQDVIDKLVIAYNNHDARAFADFFSEDTVYGTLHTELLQHGREEICQRYLEVFATYPENRTEVLQRIAFGKFVIDHKLVSRSSRPEPFHVVAIYTLKAGLIARLDFVRD